MRWEGAQPLNPAGQHPAGNYYPTPAWDVAEIVADFHLLPHPISSAAQDVALQIALAPPFTAAADLDWQTVTEVTLPPAQNAPLGASLRAQNGRFLLSGAAFAEQVRPQTPLDVVVGGFGDPAALDLFLLPVDATLPGADFTDFAGAERPFTELVQVETDVENGRYQLVAAETQSGLICGWLARPTAGCIMGIVEISGAPLPQGRH